MINQLESDRRSFVLSATEANGFFSPTLVFFYNGKEYAYHYGSPRATFDIAIMEGIKTAAKVGANRQNLIVINRDGDELMEPLDLPFEHTQEPTQ